MRDTDFALWMTAMGYSGRQVSQAGERIGLGRASSQQTYRGERALTDVERLAMAAIRAGLTPWTPGTDAIAVSMASMVVAMRQIIEQGGE